MVTSSGRQATLQGLAANVARARTVVGTAPALENVATLIEPPGSDRDEATWLADAIGVSGSPLLLDLHNLHATACNVGFDAGAALAPKNERALGAAVAMGAALVSSYFGWRLRVAAMERYGQTRTGLVEDALVAGAGLAIANPRLVGSKSTARRR